MTVKTVAEVVRGGFCVGCGICAVSSQNAILMQVNADKGTWEPDLLSSDQAALEGSQDCPFSDESPNEDQLAAARFAPGVPAFDHRIGHHLKLGAGRLADDDALKLSSSGGLTSWLVDQLLNDGLVDGVIHVGRSAPGDSQLFSYVISDDNVLRADRRKSAYYSAHMADVLNAVIGNGKRYAVVGVPCFIKAISLLVSDSQSLSAQFPYRVGLVCGHLKTSAFAEALAWQSGVRPNDLAAFDFRVKVPGEPANAYKHAAASVTSAVN